MKKKPTKLGVRNTNDSGTRTVAGTQQGADDSSILMRNFVIY